MAKTCIKCGYTRRDADHGRPDYACPSCGVVYAKAEAARAEIDAAHARTSAIAAAMAAKAATPAPPDRTPAVGAAKPGADAILQQMLATQSHGGRGPNPYKGMALVALIAFSIGFASAAGMYSVAGKFTRAAAAQAEQACKKAAFAADRGA